MTGDIEAVKKALFSKKKTFDVALNANNNEAEVNKFILGVVNTITLNPNLLNCSPESIRDVAITSATLGVPIDAKQYAYIVPYKGRAQFQLSYKGFVSVAKRDPDVDQIQSVIVYESDEFKVDMGDNTISHIPNLESDGYGKDASIKYVYAIVRFKEGTGRANQFEVMTKDAIDAIRGSAKQDYIWKAHYSEMARKTVIKRLCKHAQLGDIAKFDEIDNAVDNNRIINITPDGIVEAEDLLKKDLDAILEAYEAAESKEDLNAINSKFRERIEEITAYNMDYSKELTKAYRKKEQVFSVNEIIEFLECCEDKDGLDAVYMNHEPRMKGFTASGRKEIEETYCSLGQKMLDAGVCA